MSANGQDKASEREFYDELFRKRRRFDQFQDDIYRNIAREARSLTSGTAALDLGCGSGTQSLCLQDEGFAVMAADLSIEAVRVARATAAQAGRRLCVLNADAERLPVRDSSIDACICSLLLHHFSDLAGVASELRRVVRPGGVVVALDANGHNPPTWMFLNVVHRFRPMKRLTPNQRALRAGEIRDVMGSHGFSEFSFTSVTSALRRDWLGDSLGARLNYYTRAALLGVSKALLPQIGRGNMLLSVFRRAA
jgi:ubiquinone/menaquinone biosynthesis C-methylase UbiE